MNPSWFKLVPNGIASFAEFILVLVFLWYLMRLKPKTADTKLYIYFMVVAAFGFGFQFLYNNNGIPQLSIYFSRIQMGVLLFNFLFNLWFAYMLAGDIFRLEKFIVMLLLGGVSVGVLLFFIKNDAPAKNLAYLFFIPLCSWTTYVCYKKAKLAYQSEGRSRKFKLLMAMTIWWGGAQIAIWVFANLRFSDYFHFTLPYKLWTYIHHTLLIISLTYPCFAYLSYARERTSFHAKLVGVVLSALLILLGLAPFVLSEMLKSLPNHEPFLQRMLMGIWILIPITTLLVAIGLPLFFRHGLLGPLNRVIKGVQRINAGDLSTEVKFEINDEVGQLALQFNEMTHSLRMYSQEMEQLVTERTTELEQKNQELAVENSLERVRVRTMAMHKSEELQDVANSIFEQFMVLNIEVSTANILVFSETSQDIKCWTSNYNNRSFHIPFANVPVLKDLHQAKQNGQKLLSKNYTLEEKNQLFEYFFEKTDFRTVPDDRQKQILLADKYALSSAFSGNVAVQLTNYSRDSFSDDENKVLLRFADSFFQAYTRFLDLQTAEKQAREAQIEATLERVRSRSMAMYKSDELAEVAAVLFQQIRLLGELPDRLSIGLFEEEKGRAQVWTTDQTGFQISGRFFARLTEETSVQKMYSCWKSGQNTQVIVLQEEEFKKWLRFVREELKIEVDASRFKGQRVHNIAYFSQGWLDVLSLEPISTEMLGILLRFANAFNLSYTRFLDLQMAEKQAREAIIEAALERVRAEIASMRTSNDLQRITPLIWKELTTLQVPFIRCGVFIMDEATEKVLTYLSTPDGQAIASFELPFDSEGLTPQVVAHWRKQSIFTDEWDEAQFQSWSQSLVQQGLVTSNEAYQTNKPPSHLFLHFIPFLQGMLYVGNSTPLTQDEIQDVKALANAFATAYARYQDFSQLEVAKKQVENTLQELRATQSQLIQSEKLASLGELTAGIAHEIQNPLNFVNNFAEVSAEMLDEMHEELEKGDTTEAIAIATDLKTNLEKINHHGQRASSIVKGMLEHSRASTGVKEPTDLNALADEYLRLAYHGLRAKDNNFNATLETHFDPDLPLVSVISQDIGRVLLNLINNAFYAVSQRATTVGAPLAGAPIADAQPTGAREGHPYEPTVTVSTKRRENAIEIRVQDNGNGIPESIRDKIFQPFFTTKPTGQGTGLGLSLAYDIITKGHSGTLNVESIEGEGSKFTISLPTLP